MIAAARSIVRGRVQGVGFRDARQMQALALGLRGHAVNRVDGAVQVLAVGDAAALDALATWLQRGPDHARVDRLERTDLEVPPTGVDAGFAIG